MNRLERIALICAVAVLGASFSTSAGTAANLLAESGKGDIAAVRGALKAGCDVNGTDSSGYTALHWAAMMGHADIARLLLESGAEVNACDNRGNTPFCSAVMRLGMKGGYPALAELLLGSGADVNEADERGMALLHKSAGGTTAAVQFLLEHGADVNARDL